MDDIYAINLAKSIMREGFNRGDLEQVLSIYDNGYADMSFGFPSFYYSDANDVFRARLNQLFRYFTVNMAAIVIDIVLNGDRAMDWGWHDMKLTCKATGEERAIRTRYFETWRKDPERGWLVTSFIDNIDVSPELPEKIIRQLQAADSLSWITRLPSDADQSVPPEPS